MCSIVKRSTLAADVKCSQTGTKRTNELVQPIESHTFVADNRKTLKTIILIDSMPCMRYMGNSKVTVMGSSFAP